MTDLTPHADLRPVRLVLYSHDSLGLGHLRRNMALAHAFAEHLPGLLGRPVTGLLVTGLDTPAGRLPSGFDVVRLPGVAKGRHGYEPRDVHVPMDDLIGVRSEVLSGMLSSFAPDLVIVDRHPFGVDEELLVPLQRLRAERPATRIVLGLREVLDDPAVAAREWESVGIARVRHHVDAVWIYGDEDITDPRSTGELPATLHDLARSTGYLSLGRAGFADPAHHVPPYVLTTVGGGADGVEVCLAAAAAQVSTRHVVVTGPQMGEADRERVRDAARPGTEVPHASLGRPVLHHGSGGGRLHGRLQHDQRGALNRRPGSRGAAQRSAPRADHPGPCSRRRRRGGHDGVRRRHVGDGGALDRGGRHGRSLTARRRSGPCGL